MHTTPRFRLLVITILLLLQACDKGYDSPTSHGEELIVTATLPDLRTYYAGRPTRIEKEVIVCGRVTSSDRAGNFYRSLTIESHDAAAELMVGLDHLHNDYPIGTKLYVRLQGLTVGEQRGVLQIGHEADPASGFAVDYLPSKAAVDQHIVRSSDPIAEPIPLDCTIAQLRPEMAGRLVRIEQLPAGTPILIDMKGPYGSFFYPSKLPAAVHSASTDVQKVSELVSTLQKKGFYTIARVCAFRDWNFGNNNVTSGLYMLSRAGLWLDPDGYFWLDPTNANTTSWITDVVLELRDMGFNEVLLTDFRFPNSDKYIFNGDKIAALQTAASTLVSSCAASNFVLSFGVDDPAFALPQGRCRIYLSGITANGIGQTAAQVSVEDPTTQLAFIAETGDTRYDAYSVLRSLYISDVVEAQKKAAEQP